MRCTGTPRKCLCEASPRTQAGGSAVYSTLRSHHSVDEPGSAVALATAEKERVWFALLGVKLTGKAVFQTLLRGTQITHCGQDYEGKTRHSEIDICVGRPEELSPQQVGNLGLSVP